MYESFWSPSGMYIVLRPIDPKDPDFWVVRVLDFATWKHREVEFESEAAARTYADLWRI